MFTRIRRAVEWVCMALTLILAVPILALAFVIVFFYTLIGGAD
jgi:hypothetical protein